MVFWRYWGDPVTVGLFVEGQSDKDALPYLVEKALSPEKTKIVARRMPRGDMFSPAKMAAYVAPLRAEHPEIAKVIICVDSECTDPEEIREKTLRVEHEASELVPGLTLTHAVVVHALEGWLLADPDAVAKAVGLGSAIKVGRNPEEICKPGDLLHDIFRKSRKSFQKTRHCPQIARYVDPERLRQRCRSFERFVKLAGDP